MESVKKSIDKRAMHKREYDSRVNERQMHTTDEEGDTSKELNASLVETKSSGTNMEKQDTSSISGNDADVDDADIKPVYDEEPLAEVQLTTECNVFATGQQHTEQPEFNNEGEKCVFNANHDACVTKFLNEINSRAKFPSHKTTKRNKLVEKISVAKKPERQIPIGHRFLIKKTSAVHEKIMIPRSCLRWKQTSRIFMTVGLRWVPTGMIFTSSTTKVDSEPSNGSIEDITNQYECEQTLDVSAELVIHDHNNEPSSSKLVPKVVPPADKTATSRQELELLFSPMYKEYFNAGNPSVSTSSALSL
ncbi:hypothetical protein Tco_0893244 [Tanacetum coccineum]|uniref:Uncharacterized protein n=1 Tax=Tanacetum coccineum TaxID=301880 RepID=A0ABQ5CB45_9ASTR